MPAFVDGAYLLAAAATAPVWLWRLWATGKLRTDWPARFGRAEALPPAVRPRLLLHAVSVGEVNATRRLVELLAAGADPPEIVIASTTDTGVKRARELFAPRHAVVRYPFDLSWSVERFLRAVAPDVVALLELEVWPNFTAACARRGVPVAVINGRLSERSFRRYRPVARLMRPAFRTLAAVGAQDEAYAERFRFLGAAPERVRVTGTMKWDTAPLGEPVEGAERLAEEMGIDRGRPLVVAGSTAPGEHELLAAAVPQGVQLLCAPRKPEWFDAAAEAMTGCARRSRGERGSAAGRFLLDTIGELRQAYALADVVVVGRTFVDLGGSDMIEPVALGKATVVGPHVDNFLDSVAALEAAGGIVRTDRDGLAATLRRLLDDPAERARMAGAGCAVIRARQGATALHAEMIRELIRRRTAERRFRDGLAATG